MNRTPVSLITSKEPAILSKSFRLRDGELEKNRGGQLVYGVYEQHDCPKPSKLAELINSLHCNQALTFGVAPRQTARIASRRKAGKNEITRTRDFFDWHSGPGYLLIDYDPPRHQEGIISRTDLVAVLCEASGDISTAPMVLADSSSSWIYRTDTGECVQQQRGLRCYILINDMRDAARAGRVLHQRLWLAGHGFYVISASGQLLERSPADQAVWKPEHLDFAAGAYCEEPLEQRRPAAEYRNNEAQPFSTPTLVPDLTADEIEELEKIQSDATSAMRERQEQTRKNWIKTRLKTIKKKNKRHTKETLRAAVEEKSLDRDFELIHSTGRTVRVASLLDDPKKWHNERFADPLEPEYQNDRRIAWANLKGGQRPYLYSHAHGGNKFELKDNTETVKIRPGERPAIVRKANELIWRAGDVFRRGIELVRISPQGEIVPADIYWTRTYLESLAKWTRYDARTKKWMTTDLPSDIPRRLLAARGEWSVPELNGTIRAPIIRPDGSLLNCPGYDHNTGLFLIPSLDPEQYPDIPEFPDFAQVSAALDRLWEPFEQFPFVDNLSRANQLAALLTAAVRPVLETAPAFAWNAYRAGTGKSKAAKATAWLQGCEPEESPWSEAAEEQRKRIMSALIAGSPTILLDNISVRLESDALSALLTAARYRDRRLGSNDEPSLPARVLVTATGNNLRFVGDLNRRFLSITIDHAVERPERLVFSFDPVERMRERWLEYRGAALTILRGFLAAGAPARGDGGAGSYKQWDALIRQCVVWIRDQQLASFGLDDPSKAFTRNYAVDPETAKLRALLHAWHERHLDKHVGVYDLVEDALGDTPEPDTCRSRAYLRDALEEIAGDREGINRRRLGRWIERHGGRIIDGLRIESVGNSRGRCFWRVRRAE